MSDPDCLIDSNLLIYAYEKDEVKSEVSRALFSELSRKGRGRISIQNLVEFCNVFIHKKLKSTGKNETEEAVGFLCENMGVLTYNPDTIKTAANIAQTYGAPFYDALLAATMLENGISRIYTENTKDFENIPGITAVNPFLEK